MNEKEFKEKARERNVIIYNVENITEKDNKGIKITFVHDYGSGTVSTEKENVYWNQKKQDVFEMFLFNHWAKAPTI